MRRIFDRDRTKTVLFGCGFRVRINFTAKGRKALFARPRLRLFRRAHGLMKKKFEIPFVPLSCVYII